MFALMMVAEDNTKSTYEMLCDTAKPYENTGIKENDIFSNNEIINSCITSEEEKTFDNHNDNPMNSTVNTFSLGGSGNV